MTDISPINILIANEQAQEAKQTALSLRAFFPDSRIELVYSADEVIHWAPKSEWHTILADADLFRQSGLATLTEVKRQAPMATIIIQADCNDMTLGTQVLQYGVDFYIAKNSHAFLTELPFVLRTFLKNQDLNSRWNAANERVLRLEEQASRMQTDQQSLVEQLDQVRQERAQLQEQLQAHEVELSQTKEKKQLLLDQWEKIRQAHTTMEEELQQVTGQLTQERGENQAYKEQLEKLRQERDQIQERLFQIDEEKQSLLAQVGQTRHTYTLLEERLQRHDAELSQERNDNRVYREQLEKLRQERDHLHEQVLNIQMEKQSLVTQLGEARNTYTLLEERLQRHDAQLSQERNDNRAQREQLEKLRQEHDQIQELLLQNQIEKQSLLTQVGEARHAYTVLEERLQRHDAELLQERNDNRAQREQLEKLRQERDQIQEQLSQNQIEKQSLLTQVGEARHAYTVLEERLQRHDAELAQERNENQAHREQLEKLRQERDQIQEQLSQNQIEKQSLLTQSEQLRLEHSQMEERIKRLEERLLQEQRDKAL